MVDTHTERVIHVSRACKSPGRREGDEGRYDIECDHCGWIVASDTRRHAAALARLHEEFVAVLVDRWEVPS